tara:strand:- start:4064 stop:4624 length:561 start_codon:yes stop_codon:yes gene_type:complete
MDDIRKFKYKKIKNFLSKQEINLLKIYCDIKHRIYSPNKNMTDTQSTDSSYYGDPAMEALLLSKHKKMEKLTGLKLFPTYAYWRMYTYGAILKEHDDRQSCEISVTVCIDKEKIDWPIYIDGTRIDMEPGDAAIYLGCELKHWREEFKGDFQAQAFLHYVDQHGPNAEWRADKRMLFGTKQQTQGG